jgi:hypothetical protein
MGIVRHELSQWFPAHAEMMDAALVFTMAQRGFDPATGQCRVAVTEGPAGHSCGSGSCGG